MMSRNFPAFTFEGEEMKFTDPIVVEANQKLRARLLTQEDMEHLAQTSVITPFEMPSTVKETETIATLSRALRLTDHETRPEYAAMANSQGLWPDALMTCVSRNEHGHVKPLPSWVSTATMNLAINLPFHFGGRISPLWGGAAQLLVFVDDEDLEYEPGTAHLASFVFEHFSTADAALCMAWISEIPKWQRHFDERHHRCIEASRLLSEHKAVLIKFDIASIVGSGIPMETAFQLYHDVAAAIYRKRSRNEFPNASDYTKLATIMSAQLTQFLAGIPNEAQAYWSHAKAIFDASVMFKIESRLYVETSSADQATSSDGAR